MGGSGEDDEGGGSRPQPAGGATTEDGVAGQMPPRQEETKEPENAGGVLGDAGPNGGGFINQGKKGMDLFCMLGDTRIIKSIRFYSWCHGSPAYFSLPTRYMKYRF